MFMPSVPARTLRRLRMSSSELIFFNDIPEPGAALLKSMRGQIIRAADFKEQSNFDNLLEPNAPNV